MPRGFHLPRLYVAARQLTVRLLVMGLQTRTNTAAWLEFQQDEVVARLERILANVTSTEPGTKHMLARSICSLLQSLSCCPGRAPGWRRAGLCAGDVCQIFVLSVPHLLSQSNPDAQDGHTGEGERGVRARARS